MKRKLLLFTLALPFMLQQGAHAQSSRLIGQADWQNIDHVFTPVDSTAYVYSGGRGGDLTHQLKYDNSTLWNFFDSAYVNTNYRIETFDANNNVTSLIVEYWTGTAWQLSTNTLYTYNSSNQVTSTIVQSWGGSAWQPVSRDLYSYNTAGKLYLDQYQTWNGTAFVNSTQKTYYYDGSNNKINETDQAYVSGSPVYTNQWTYSYSTTNQLLSTTYYSWSGSAWAPVSMISNTYNSAGEMTYTLNSYYNTATSSFVNSTLHTYTGFTSGLMPTMDAYQTWDTATGVWNNVMQYTYSYNTANQKLSSVGESWNIVGLYEFANGDPMARYYYESYTPASTFVNNTLLNADDANIYPVPAQNMLHLDVKWAVAQTADITIYDAMGKVVRQWNAPSVTEYNSAVSVNGLADGTYFVKIAGEKNQIVKQLVIAH